MRIIRHRLHGCYGSDHQATDRTDDTAANPPGSAAFDIRVCPCSSAARHRLRRASRFQYDSPNKPDRACEKSVGYYSDGLLDKNCWKRSMSRA
jgi:hypothetical protein